MDVALFHLACPRWFTNLLDVDLIEEKRAGWMSDMEVGFVIPGWFMPYFHLLTFGNSKQYGEGEMSRFIVFVYVFVFNLALALSSKELCWK